jgi:hypothetical protein
MWQADDDCPVNNALSKSYCGTNHYDAATDDGPLLMLLFASVQVPVLFLGGIGCRPRFSLARCAQSFFAANFGID